MDQADKEVIMEALKVCSSYENDKCKKCPYGWMDDHAQDCQPQMAEDALKLIKELENKPK